MSLLIQKLFRRRMPLLIIAAVAAGLIYGCQDSKIGSAYPTTMASPEDGKGGAQLWAENCARCHNMRPPTEFSSDQWQVIVHEMRVRANLTGQEQRKILEFLQSASM